MKKERAGSGLNGQRRGRESERRENGVFVLSLPPVKGERRRWR